MTCFFCQKTIDTSGRYWSNVPLVEADDKPGGAPVTVDACLDCHQEMVMDGGEEKNASR